jgi:hypothetical protein
MAGSRSRHRKAWHVDFRGEEPVDPAPDSSEAVFRILKSRNAWQIPSSEHLSLPGKMLANACPDLGDCPSTADIGHGMAWSWSMAAREGARTVAGNRSVGLRVASGRSRLPVNPLSSSR